MKPFRRFFATLGPWLESRSGTVNQRGIVKDIYAGVELSPGYLFMLALADLIALCGLLEGSAPVIIGAMLISPLMGPFLNVGFAFVTGDDLVWRKSLRKVVLSVAFTLAVAALATCISPLKELTGEILSRTRPNLYDLIIAFLAGLAGASALCTKKDYVTVVPGVAIATAVIPPLCVAGYGLGTWNLKVLLGGFFLFFTNLVAIIIATCAVFYFYGFRRNMPNELELSQMKLRLVFLLAVLVLICIPLGYTVYRAVGEAELRGTVRGTLRRELDLPQRSHLTTFSFRQKEGGDVRVDALVNVVRYLDREEVRRVESSLAKALGRQASLNLEQVKVRVGGLREVSPPSVAPAAQHPTEGGAAGLGEALGREKLRLARILAPAKLEELSLAMGNYSSSRIAVRLRVARDVPLSAAEETMLGRILAEDLGHPVDLQAETTEDPRGASTAPLPSPPTRKSGSLSAHGGPVLTQPEAAVGAGGANPVPRDR